MENKINKIYKQIVTGERINSLPSRVLLNWDGVGGGAAEPGIESGALY